MTRCSAKVRSVISCRGSASLVIYVHWRDHSPSHFHAVYAGEEAQISIGDLSPFEDGTEGEADLSDVAGRGVFKRWTENPDEFRQVQIDPISGAPTWPGDLDVAPDRLYEEVVGLARQVEPGRSG